MTADEIQAAAGPDESRPTAKQGREEEAFDPAQFVRTRRIWCFLGRDTYFMPGPDGRWMDLGKQNFTLWLKAEGLRRGTAHEPIAEVEKVLLWTQGNRALDAVFDGLAGHHEGVHNYENRRLLVLHSPTLIEPRKGPFPLITGFIQQLLPAASDGTVQWLIFCLWLRVAVEALRAGKRRPGQLLVIVGTPDCGKSRLQHNILTPCLGGRHADPGPFLLGESRFNSEMFSSEHLLCEDIASGLRREDRHKLKQNLKRLAANDSARFEEKGRPAFTLSPLWRCSLSLNSGPDDLGILPPPSADFSEKCIMLLAERPDCLPGGTEAERAAFRDQITAELPAFLHFLIHDLDELVPAEMKAGRFGVRSYENPAIRASMLEEVPERMLLEMVDSCAPWLSRESGHWIGKASELRALFESDAGVSGDFARWDRHNNLTRCLGRLKEDLPLRVAHVHRASGGFWKLFPPAPGGHPKIEPST